jgi:hypothetical protein
VTTGLSEQYELRTTTITYARCHYFLVHLSELPGSRFSVLAHFSLMDLVVRVKSTEVLDWEGVVNMEGIIGFIILISLYSPSSSSSTPVTTCLLCGLLSGFMTHFGPQCLQSVLHLLSFLRLSVKLLVNVLHLLLQQVYK